MRASWREVRRSPDVRTPEWHPARRRTRQPIVEGHQRLQRIKRESRSSLHHGDAKLSERIGALSPLELELKCSTPAWCGLGQQIGQPAVERLGQGCES